MSCHSCGLLSGALWNLSHNCSLWGQKGEVYMHQIPGSLGPFSASGIDSSTSWWWTGRNAELIHTALSAARLEKSFRRKQEVVGHLSEMRFSQVSPGKTWLKAICLVTESRYSKRWLRDSKGCVMCPKQIIITLVRTVDIYKEFAFELKHGNSSVACTHIFLPLDSWR